MDWGFCNSSNRKLACESPSTTPTPYHILNLRKERKREDKGKEEARKRETQPGEHRELNCHGALKGKQQNHGSPWRHTDIQPSDRLLRGGFGTNDVIASGSFTISSHS